MVEIPAFSIVIPTYNYASYIGTALDSIFAQNRNDIEVIVVDDASTDDTQSVIGNYMPNINYFRLEKNVGPGAAWVFGIQRATGKYICKLDADDWYVDGFFSQIENIFEENEDVGIVASSVYLCQDGDKMASIYSVCPNNQILLPEEFRAQLLRGFNLRVPGIAIRGEAIRNHNHPIGKLFLGHDWEYVLRVTKGWCCYLINKPLAVYRIHKKSVTQSAIKERRIMSCFAIWLELCRQRNTRYYIPDNERKVLAVSMVTIYLRIIGVKNVFRPSFVRELNLAIKLVIRESPIQLLSLAIRMIVLTTKNIVRIIRRPFCSKNTNSAEIILIKNLLPVKKC